MTDPRATSETAWTNGPWPEFIAGIKAKERAAERERIRAAVEEMCIRVNRLNDKHPGSEYMQGRAAAFAEVMRDLDPKEAE